MQRPLAVPLRLAIALLLLAPPLRAAEEALPLPPDIPRLTTSPQFDECLDLLQQDPDDALTFAGSWEAAGGGEGARHCAALALMALGESEKAAERLEQLARNSQGSATARAAVFGQAAQAWVLAKQPGRAFAAATMGLIIAPHDLDLAVDRAVILGNLGRYAEALDDLDQVLQAAPDRAEAWVYRAAALRHLDRIDLAAQAAERALTLVPDNAEALLERGIIRQMKGDTDGARADWEAAIRVAPDSPAADLAQQNLALNEAGPNRR